jgi:predicted nucleic acid-binding protein
VYLADTNIFLEALLEQERANEVQQFLQSIDLDAIFITDFSLNSIGIALFNRKKYASFTSFVEDMIVGGIHILSLSLEDLRTLNLLVRKFNLDFDDAYQYAVADKYNLQLISFDQHFDQTDKKRKEPIDLLR